MQQRFVNNTFWDLQTIKLRHILEMTSYCHCDVKLPQPQHSHGTHIHRPFSTWWVWVYCVVIRFYWAYARCFRPMPLFGFRFFSFCSMKTFHKIHKSYYFSIETHFVVTEYAYFIVDKGLVFIFAFLA